MIARKRNLRIQLCLLVVVFLVLACQQSATVTPQATYDIRVLSTLPPTLHPALIDLPRIEGMECPFFILPGVDMECMYVVVPADHRDPDLGLIRLAIVILRDDSENHKEDPVFLLSGGPGEKIVEYALGAASMLDALHPQRDLILFDQRGVGHSLPALECLESEQESINSLDESDPDRVADDYLYALKICKQRLEEEGINLSAFNSSQSAADVDYIRRVLRYDQINLYGASYGSLLAQVYMREYPQHVRSAVIGSVLPLEISFIVESDRVVAETMLEIVDACAADSYCAEAFPDLGVVLFETIDRLDAEPAEMVVTNLWDDSTITVLLSGDMFFNYLVSLMYQTDYIPLIPRIIFAAAEGDYTLLTELQSMQVIGGSPISRGMQLSVMCSEDLVGKEPQDLQDVRAALPPQLIGSFGSQTDQDFSIFTICDLWAVEQVDPAFKEPLVSDIPVLILEGEFDPVTPTEFGELVASHLEYSYVFEFPGIGHDFTVSSDCARSIAGEFVQDPARELRATCTEEQTGVSFDVPGYVGNLELEAYVDEFNGFRSVIPVGWQELAPGVFVRQRNILDWTYFMLDAYPASKDEMGGNLAAELGMDYSSQLVEVLQLGMLTWDRYHFNLEGSVFDLALAEENGLTYQVILISDATERDQLYEELFLVALAEMESLY